MNKLHLIFLIFLLIPVVSATTIYGTVYDMALEPAENSIIKVNTIPEQQIVSKDGSYSFDLPLGSYTLYASYDDGREIYSTTQNVKVVGSGEYIVDLILFIDLSDDEALLNDEINNINLGDNKNYLTQFLITFFIAFTTIFLAIFFMKKNKKTIRTDEELSSKVLEFIKSQEGRTTQKEIRKEFPFSEAKISLVITELVHKKKIDKIKKGKGNIIILKK